MPGWSWVERVIAISDAVKRAAFCLKPVCSRVRNEPCVLSSVAHLAPRARRLVGLYAPRRRHSDTIAPYMAAGSAVCALTRSSGLSRQLVQSSREQGMARMRARQMRIAMVVASKRWRSLVSTAGEIGWSAAAGNNAEAALAAGTVPTRDVAHAQSEPALVGGQWGGVVAVAVIIATIVIVLTVTVGALPL